MKLIELANRENELYSVVTSLNISMEGKEAYLEELGVFEDYFKIHQEYARLHKDELEALKRGLFLSWYSKIESPYLTGIREIDPVAEHELFRTLDKKLKQKKTDYELDWMLSYYANWDFAFAPYVEYENLQNKLKTKPVPMPKYIDKNGMSTRGQMGIYWSFIDFFE